MDLITMQSNGENIIYDTKRAPRESTTSTASTPSKAGNVLAAIGGVLPSVVTAGLGIAGAVQSIKDTPPGATPVNNYFTQPAEEPTFFEKNKMYLIGGGVLILVAVAAYFITKK